MLNYINGAAADRVINSQLKKQLESQCNYWSEGLQRVVAVVKFLSDWLSEAPVKYLVELTMGITWAFWK